MSIKMKGLVKGLRYISQIFDNEKEREIQIGYPTDVKHVAHIGWDSPSSTNSAPSWMNDFKSPSGFSSAPLGTPVNPKEGGSPKWNSEDLARRGGSIQPCGSTDRDLLELPKSSRRQSSSATTTANSSLESPTKLKSEKSRQSSRRSAKGSQSHARDLADGASRTSGRTADLESSSPARPDVPKKSRRKKSKESSVGGSSLSSTRSSKGRTTTLTNESPMLDMGSDSGPLSMPENCDQFVQPSKIGSIGERDEKAISRIT